MLAVDNLLYNKKARVLFFLIDSRRSIVQTCWLNKSRQYTVQVFSRQEKDLELVQRVLQDFIFEDLCIYFLDNATMRIVHL